MLNEATCPTYAGLPFGISVCNSPRESAGTAPTYSRDYASCSGLMGMNVLPDYIPSS